MLEIFLDSAIKGTRNDLLSQARPIKRESKGLQIGTNPNFPPTAQTRGGARFVEDLKMELRDDEETMIEMALYQELAGGGYMAYEYCTPSVS